MSDLVGDPGCEHTYARGSDECAICGRYRHADAVKAMVDEAPPLTQSQIDRLTALFNVGSGKTDWTRVMRTTSFAEVIERHPLVHYPTECACGDNFKTRQAWARHVGDALLGALETAHVVKPRKSR